MNILGYDLQEGVVFIIRIIATIGGAVVGWFVCDPITRIVHRLIRRTATPGGLLFCGKALGGAALALAVWFLMPEGGGNGGGPGFGPGKGGLPSSGGTGGAKSEVAVNAKPDAKIDAKDQAPRTLESVEIEIISGKLFEKLHQEDGKERFFLLKRAQPALTADELDAYLKKNHAKIEVTPILTKESIGIGGKDNPLEQLLSLTKKYHVKTLQRKEL